MPFLTYDPFPQCLQQSPLTPLLLARVTSEEVGAIYQTLSVSRPEAPEPVLPEVTPGLSRTRANREKVGTSMPIWRDGGVDGWIVLGGPARAGPGGGGGGGDGPGGGGGGRRRARRAPPPGGGGPRRGASCRRAAGRRPEAADRRRGGGGAA